MKCFAFDFDGVLVDSYSCLPSVYKKLAEYFEIEDDEFIEEAIKLEDKYDAMEVFDRRIWWESFFKKYGILDIERALQIYWDERIKESRIMKNCVGMLKWLKRGNILAIVAGNDGIKSMKKRRIEKSGLAGFFDEILIVNEEINSKLDGILYLMEKYGLNEKEIIFIDDKPMSINQVKNRLKNVIAVKMEFQSILKEAWKGDCKADYKIKSLIELKDLF